MSAVSPAGASPLRPDAPLSIAYLTYRGKPHVGGQGVYTRHLTKALVDLGHSVEVFAGQPYPMLDERIKLHKLPSLDLWNDHFPGRFPGYWELKSKADWAESFSHLRGTFGEPLAFSMRALKELKPRMRDFDLVHDNQCLGYSILGIEKLIPTIVTLHHPITRDRALEMAHTENWRAPLLHRTLVQLREDAGSRRQPHAAHRRRQRELDQRHPRRHGRQPRPHATGAGRRRSRVVHAAAARRSQARPADHHRLGRRRA